MRAHEGCSSPMAFLGRFGGTMGRCGSVWKPVCHYFVIPLCSTFWICLCVITNLLKKMNKLKIRSYLLRISLNDCQLSVSFDIDIIIQFLWIKVKQTNLYHKTWQKSSGPLLIIIDAWGFFLFVFCFFTPKILSFTKPPVVPHLCICLFIEHKRSH